MEGITIREYAQDDWARIEAIHDSARRDELRHAGLEAAFLPLSVAAEREGLFDYALRVAEVKGRVVGFVAYTEDELAWLYVDPACARRGIGRALAGHVIADTTARPLQVELLRGNLPARRLYESIGFVYEKTAEGVMPGNEEFAVTVWEMALGG